MIRFIQIAQDEFDSFLKDEIGEYAQDKIKSGNWQPDTALEKSRAEFMSLLPEGLQTRGQYIFSIFDDEKNCSLGVMWFQVNMEKTPRRAFINDFVLKPEFRGQGYGKKAMKVLDETLRSMQVTSVSLHVFAHNTNAIALYEKSGYKVTNLYMGKDL